jgi:murein DD-endopeptidase MepM/ murein hydrolase activator NlpD
VEDARERLSAFSADAYRGSGLVDADAMLAVGTAADLIDGLSYLERLAARQREALARVTAARLTAREAQNASYRAKTVADDARRAAETALRQAEAAENRAADAERELTALAATRAEALRVATEDRAATEARYQDLQQDSARIAAEIRALAQAGGAPVLSGGARLPMPVRGWKSSDFGLRFHPIYHVWQLHTGVDLAAAGGAPIWAVAPGRVFRAGWSGGYGNYTCIYHGLYQGRGFATCYAHQSAILVGVGQNVQRGQVIGRVGTTGTSTGNHLHFEVRLDGEPVDPVRWLPPCLC